MQAGPNPYPHGSDAYYLREALEQAQGGLGWTSPEPSVGCVLVRDEQVIGRGFHPRYGARHAEHEALHTMEGEARGATAFVSLEPCSVERAGAQSCCHLLTAAGVSEVVYGTLDTDARNGGHAAATLGAQGITVRTPRGTGAAEVQRECRRFLDYYNHGQLHGSPFMHLKLALSLDAKLATAEGASQWLSGPRSLGYAHYLRQKYDAILVGYRTVLMDDARLTVRPEVFLGYRKPASELRNPLRIVLDPHWEVLARLGEQGGARALSIGDLSGTFRDHLPKLILAGRKDAPFPEERPTLDGLEVLGLEPDEQGRLSFAELRAGLWKLGVRSVLVEGGAGVAQSLLAQRQVDRLSAVYTPRLLGSDALGFSPPLALAKVAEGMFLDDVEACVLGEDVMLSGYPQWPDRGL
jgi:diaminohydroxyphosphoribosylaminopyrimidine deaminase/5-amino-6-(5-phosphoribosylamino)uracil reductase